MAGFMIGHMSEPLVWCEICQRKDWAHAHEQACVNCGRLIVFDQQQRQWYHRGTGDGDCEGGLLRAEPS